MSEPNKHITPTPADVSEEPAELRAVPCYKHYPVGDVVRILSIHPSTVRRWALVLGMDVEEMSNHQLIFTREQVRALLEYRAAVAENDPRVGQRKGLVSREATAPPRRTPSARRTQ